MLIELDNYATIPSDQLIRCCAISNKGHIAIATDQKILYLYYQINLSWKKQLSNLIHQLEFTTNSLYLVYATDRWIYILNIAHNSCSSYSINKHQYLLLILNQLQCLFVQNQFYTDYNSKNVCHFDFKRNKRIRKIEIEMERNYYPIVMTYTQHGHQIATGNQNIFVIDLKDAEIIWCEFDRTQGTLQQLAFVDESKVLALRMQCTYLQLYSKYNGELLIQVDYPNLQCISQVYIQNNSLYAFDEKTGKLYRQYNGAQQCIMQLPMGSQLVFHSNKLLCYWKSSLRLLEGI